MNNYLESNTLFKNKALKQQVPQLAITACDLYYNKRHKQLEELLETVAPAAAFMLNIEISLVHNNYMEEGATLARTLLPYLNQLRDYHFLTEKTNFIACRFLASLVRQINDTQITVGAGFVLYALKLNPTML